MSGQDAVSWLFVPGDRPDRFDKAARCGADEVICDLEDAVLEAGKRDARRHIGWWLSHGGGGWVRVNAVSTGHYEPDIAELAGLPGLRWVVVLKAEAPAMLQSLGRRLGQAGGIVALIETARGLLRAHDIACCDAVSRLSFGSIDFAACIDAAEDDEALRLARATLVVASRAAGKPPPIDGVTVALDRPAPAAADAARARRLGFGGKLCIHPAQVGAVAAAFRPTAAEVHWAGEVVGAAGSLTGVGAAQSSGQMIDKPVIERARRILAQRGLGHRALRWEGGANAPVARHHRGRAGTGGGSPVRHPPARRPRRPGDQGRAARRR